jgi:SP family arabinose:H+ symporter-like MFS transporter
MIAGKLSNALGRKKSMLICSFLFAITGIATGWAANFTVFIFARLLSGVAVGAAALVCPMYIAEVAPAFIRGRLVTFYQLAIVTGLLMAYLSNYLLLNTGENNWRWMFSSQTVPALLFFSGLFFVPESPRWLIKIKRIGQAFSVLTKIGGDAYAKKESTSIQKSFLNDVKANFGNLFRKDIRRIIFIGIVVAVFSQAVGQNSLFSYAPVIFQQAGLGTEEAFLQSVIIGVTNFVFTFVAIYFIERIGRRRLLMYGSILAALDAMALALSFYSGANGYITLLFVLIFIAIYAATLGPVTWVLLSEIFPNGIRSDAMAISTLSLWIANFFTTASFPIMKSAFGIHATFAFHACICFIYFLWIKATIPETKGRTLEEIELQLIKR